MLSKVEASGSEVNASERATTPIGTDALVGLRSHRPPVVEPQDLGAAAADVDQQGRPGAALDQRQAAQQRQERLLLVVQDFELDSGGAADPGQELGAVGGAAAGLGRNAARLLDPVPRHDPCAHPKRRDGPRHCPFAEPAARGQAFTEAHDPREAVDHLEAVGVRSGDQQTAVIGPQVESSQRLRAPPCDR